MEFSAKGVTFAACSSAAGFFAKAGVTSAAFSTSAAASSFPGAAFSAKAASGAGITAFFTSPAASSSVGANAAAFSAKGVTFAAFSASVAGRRHLCSLLHIRSLLCKSSIRRRRHSLLCISSRQLLRRRNLLCKSGSRHRRHQDHCSRQLLRSRSLLCKSSISLLRISSRQLLRSRSLLCKSSIRRRRHLCSLLCISSRQLLHSPSGAGVTFAAFSTSAATSSTGPTSAWRSCLWPAPPAQPSPTCGRRRIHVCSILHISTRNQVNLVLNRTRSLFFGCGFLCCLLLHLLFSTSLLASRGRLKAWTSSLLPPSLWTLLLLAGEQSA